MALNVLCAGNPGSFHIVRHIEILAEAGVYVHLIDHSDGPSINVAAAASNTRWPRSGRRTLARLVGQTPANAVADRLIGMQLRAIARKRQIDLFHVHWADDRILALAKAGLRPLVVTIYGSDLNFTQLPSFNPLLLRQVKQGLADADLVIADSDDMIELAERLADKKLHSLLLPIGIDTNLFRPGYREEASQWRKELDIPADAEVVLSPRLIKSNYRHCEILEGFAYAVRKHGFHGYIVFKAFLSDPNYIEQVRARASELDVADRVRIIDEIPYRRLPVLYAMGDIVVNFPVMDAFPVTFLEASACDIPILTHRLPAYKSNGMAGFLNFMEGHDPASIGARLAGLCGDQGVKERARAARRHVMGNFDEAMYRGALVNAYERLLGRAD